ncbi:guanine-specific ribonuclease N1 and T1 [Gordonia sp. X0973]|uniref:ribonuclease domain-containing protein n=1 Tax=Gordonia sp. X0973 TaxID=2742602 RepID=UPI000F51F097|nr:ribonuclease domain-containing protein [Gordonia sp. X0973]QKT06124.1 guanine-specific ribonuclease N1 and T1 [Gordonia sp. X0973]
MSNNAKNRAAATWFAIGVALTVLVVGLIWLLGGSRASDPTGSNAPVATAQHGQHESAQGQAPERVLRTLALIDAGRWPKAANAPGTHGGRTFRNNEGQLPATDSTGGRARYQEWDVNAKRPGRGRDAERIITGADGSAWYTLDHYRTFHQIRGPGAHR